MHLKWTLDLKVREGDRTGYQKGDWQKKVEGWPSRWRLLLHVNDLPNRPFFSWANEDTMVSGRLIGEEMVLLTTGHIPLRLLTERERMYRVFHLKNVPETKYRFHVLFLCFANHFFENLHRVGSDEIDLSRIKWPTYEGLPTERPRFWEVDPHVLDFMLDPPVKTLKYSLRQPGVRYIGESVSAEFILGMYERSIRIHNAKGDLTLDVSGVVPTDFVLAMVLLNCGTRYTLHRALYEGLFTGPLGVNTTLCPIDHVPLQHMCWAEQRLLTLSGNFDMKPVRKLSEGIGRQLRERVRREVISLQSVFQQWISRPFTIWQDKPIGEADTVFAFFDREDHAYGGIKLGSSVTVIRSRYSPSPLSLPWHFHEIVVPMESVFVAYSGLVFADPIDLRFPAEALPEPPLMYEAAINYWLNARALIHDRAQPVSGPPRRKMARTREPYPVNENNAYLIARHSMRSLDARMGGGVEFGLIVFLVYQMGSQRFYLRFFGEREKVEEVAQQNRVTLDLVAQERLPVVILKQYEGHAVSAFQTSKRFLYVNTGLTFPGLEDDFIQDVAFRVAYPGGSNRTTLRLNIQKSFRSCLFWSILIPLLLVKYREEEFEIVGRLVALGAREPTAVIEITTHIIATFQTWFGIIVAACQGRPTSFKELFRDQSFIEALFDRIEESLPRLREVFFRSTRYFLSENNNNAASRRAKKK